MTHRLIFAMPGNEVMAARLATSLATLSGTLETRRFPDGETYLRIVSPVEGCSVALVMTLAQPDERLLPLLFAAKTLRELGAAHVGLIAPYLSYMRQDCRFHEGEAVTSRLFAGLLSQAFDWLVTVDPHLHRYRALSEIYSIPAVVAEAASSISQWIETNIDRPILIGPDVESLQWVEAVAKLCGAPTGFLKKSRLGDRAVEIDYGEFTIPLDRTPVVLDDIISSGETMLKAVRLIRARARRSPLCIATHGLFSNDSHIALQEEEVRIVTTNTVPNRWSEIDISGSLADSVRRFLAA